MNLFNIFKKNNKSQTIASFNELIVIPKRNQIDENNYIELDKIKQNYIQIISQNKYLTSDSLSDKNIEKDIKKNIDLILNICYKNDYINSLEKKINIIKLKMYLDDINMTKNKILLEIISLNEILKEKVFLSKNKKESIKNQINILTNTYIILLTQIKAINNEVNNYINEYSINENISNKDIDDLLLYEKKTSKDFIPNITKKIMSYNVNKLVKIALFEKYLEDYTYNNKVTFLNEINNLKYTDDINYLNKLESELRLFDRITRNIVTEEMKEKFYNIKFEYLEKNILSNKDSNLIETDDYENHYYEKILIKKIHDYTNNKNIDSSLKLSLINYLKNDNIFNVEKILKDKLKLTILLNINNRKELMSIFDNMEIDSSTYGNKIYPNSTITPTFLSILLYLYNTEDNDGKNLSKLFFDLMDVKIKEVKDIKDNWIDFAHDEKGNYDNKHSIFILNNTNLVKIDEVQLLGRNKMLILNNVFPECLFNYPFEKVKLDTFYMYMSKAIIHIGNAFNYAITILEIPSKINIIFNYAFENNEYLQNIILNDNIQFIGDYAFFYCTNLQNVVLSNNLQKIGDYAFCGCKKLEYIEIPNSVKTIGENAFKDCYDLKEIKINNLDVYYNNIYAFDDVNLDIIKYNGKSLSKNKILKKK